MVPVISKENKPLMPCSEKRARLMMDRKEAKAYWQKGIFCIKLCKEVKDPKFQAVALGIDPGSKREGYTVATEKHVVLNITTNTKDWVKKHVETRRSLRNARRHRNCPYRKSKNNRSSFKIKNKTPPSTKTRWLTKINIIKYLQKILPITIINIEDIKAKTKKGQKEWNTSFSPLQSGKKLFYEEILILNIKLIKTLGFNTHLHRISRNFIKDKKNKLDYRWEVHNVDSHSLCEIAFKKNIIPFKSVYKIEFIKYFRRQLHVISPITGNFRKEFGKTISLQIPKGSVVIYKNKLCYIGGTSKNKISIYNIISAERLGQCIKKENINVLYKQNRRVQYLSINNKWKSLNIFLQKKKDVKWK